MCLHDRRSFPLLSFFPFHFLSFPSLLSPLSFSPLLLFIFFPEPTVSSFIPPAVHLTFLQRVFLLLFLGTFVS